MQTVLLQPDQGGITRAARLLRSGALVALPTETVYGLAGDARNPDAIAAIYAAKGRPAHNPLIVHVAGLEQAQLYALLDGPLLALARAFWPGPLTLLAPLRAGHGLADAVTAGLPDVALRVPAHPVAQALLRAFDGPLAAPSANPSGRISPTNAAHVVAGLGGRIAGIVDAGACPVGVESSILGLHDGTPVILRAGGLSAEDMAPLLGHIPALHRPEGVTAPGQLSSHYAPRGQVRLGVTAPQAGEYWIGFGPDCDGAQDNLSPTGDLAQAAGQLFAALHRADASGQPIAVAPVPDTGLGRAINDRLRRAAAPR